MPWWQALPTQPKPQPPMRNPDRSLWRADPQLQSPVATPSSQSLCLLAPLVFCRLLSSASHIGCLLCHTFPGLPHRQAPFSCHIPLFGLHSIPSLFGIGPSPFHRIVPCFFDKGATPQQIWQPPCSPCSSFVVTDQLCWPLDRMRLWFGRETKITLLFTHLDLSYDVQYTCRSNGGNWKQILQGFNVHFYNAGKSPQIWKKVMMKRQNKFFSCVLVCYRCSTGQDSTNLWWARVDRAAHSPVRGSQGSSALSKWAAQLSLRTATISNHLK